MNTDVTPQAIDPDRLLERLEADRVRLDDQGPLELYHRSSVVLRVRRERNGSRSEVHLGRDDGVAVRRGGASCGPFASASGSGLEALRWAAARASAGEDGPAPADETWADREEPAIDHDPDLRLPSPPELAAWIDRAHERIAAGAAGNGRRPTPDRVWVEVATTVESWVADGGLRASRSRARAWAAAQWHDRRFSTRPVFVAARRWSELQEESWQASIDDRTWPSDRPGKIPRTRIPVLFGPEASATLVLTLVRAVHGDPANRESSVGPAWRIEDDPTEAGSLFGGRFDDAGFPTRRTVLADGDRVRGLIDGRGWFRRSSYRDPPAPMPSNLKVQPAGSTLPATCVLAYAMRVHPLERRRWIIEIDGGLLERGEPGPAIRGGSLQVDPHDLVRRCVATFGEARSSHRGVTTPGLLFEDLEVDQPAAPS